MCTNTHYHIWSKMQTEKLIIQKPDDIINRIQMSASGYIIRLRNAFIKSFKNPIPISCKRQKLCKIKPFIPLKIPQKRFPVEEENNYCEENEEKNILGYCHFFGGEKGGYWIRYISSKKEENFFYHTSLRISRRTGEAPQE